jgi:hypothetical protein
MRSVAHTWNLKYNDQLFRGDHTMSRLLGALAVGLLATMAVAAPKVFVTTECSKHGQREFSFSLEPGSVPDADIGWLKSTLENWVASGERFKPEETIQLGSVLLKTTLAKDGTLHLLEPDMVSMPIDYVDSVARTLMLTRRQKDTVESVADANATLFAPLHEPLMISSDAMTAKTLGLFRDTKEIPGTGWVVFNVDSKLPEDKVEYSPMSVYEAVLKRPEIAGFLALPSGYQVAVVSAKEFVISKDGNEVVPVKGSYLDRLLKSN